MHAVDAHDVGVPKAVEFRGRSLEDLRAFPVDARRQAGYQIDRLQRGLEPDDWKPMNVIGTGAKEIRVQDAAGAFRVVYVLGLADVVYVLHCFQKKSRKTSRHDIALASQRFRELLKEHPR
jgi:phage-related protein